MAAIKSALQFAWHGSGRRWDGVPLQLVGSAIGGFAFWYWGIKLPQEILDNPAISGIIAIVIGGVSGVIAVFFLRLCWWPFHVRLAPHCGLWSFLQKYLGAQMWPVILTASGIFLFAALSGGGLIWLALQIRNGTGLVGASGETKLNETPNTVGSPDFSLHAPVGRYKFKWDPAKSFQFDIRLDTDRNPDIWSNPAFILRNRTNTVAYRLIAIWKSETSMNIEEMAKNSDRLSTTKLILQETSLVVTPAEGKPFIQPHIYYLNDAPRQVVPVIAKNEEVYFPEALKPLAAIYLIDKTPDKIGETSPPFVARVTLEWETSDGKRQRAYRVRVSATNAKASNSDSPVIDAFLNFSVEEIQQ